MTVTKIEELRLLRNHGHTPEDWFHMGTETDHGTERKKFAARNGAVIRMLGESSSSTREGAFIRRRIKGAGTRHRGSSDTRRRIGVNIGSPQNRKRLAL